MAKKVLIQLPPAMLSDVDYISLCEHRTRSDLIREALRRYLTDFKRSNGGTMPALPNGAVAKTHEVEEVTPPLSAGQISGRIAPVEQPKPIEQPKIEEPKVEPTEPVTRTSIIGFQNKTIVPAQPPDTGFVWTRNPR